jgi:hypothetical protein
MVTRCAAYSGDKGRKRGGARSGGGQYYDCAEYQEVYSPALGEPVRRCKMYSPMGGCCNCGGELGYVGMRQGGRVSGGDSANVAAAARNPWLKFVRKYAKQHPELAHNRPEMLRMASIAYHQ